MIIDIHSHIGDPWYAYWKKNVQVEDHLASMDRWGMRISRSLKKRRSWVKMPPEFWGCEA